MSEEYKPKKQRYTFDKYIGRRTSYDEELYFKDITFDCGWYWGGVYVEGLMAMSEEQLREQAKQVKPEEYYDKDTVNSGYFDREKFYDDMEEEWYERADVEREEERNGETIYLCNGSHTHADTIFFEETNSYDELKEEYKELAITRQDYSELMVLMKKFYDLKKGIENTHQRQPTKYLQLMKEMEDHLELMEKWNNGEELEGEFKKWLKEQVLLNQL